jgi:hypothetical protein
MSKGGLAGLSVNFNLSSFGCKIILLLGLRIYQWLDLRAFTFRTFSVGPSSQILSCQSRVLPDNVAGIPSRRNLEYKETPNDIKPWETNDCDSQTTMTVRGQRTTGNWTMLSAASRDMRHETMKVSVATLGIKKPRWTRKDRKTTPRMSRPISVFIIYFIKTYGP